MRIHHSLAAICVAALLVNFCFTSVALGRDNTSGVARFFFGNDVYDVPVEYLPGESQDGPSGGYSAFGLSLLLPDFTPAAKNLDEFNAVGWHNQLRVLIEYTTKFVPPEKIIRDALEFGRLKSDSWTYDSHNCRLYLGNFLIGQEYHYCITDEGPIAFTCGSEHDGSYPYCKSFQNIGDKTTMIYSFSRKYADRALDIDRKIKGLLSEFKKTKG